MAQEDPFDAYMRSKGVTLSAEPAKATETRGKALQEEAAGDIAPRKVQSDVANTEAGTKRTTTQTKVDERTLELPNLSPGGSEADKKFADSYLAWRAGDVGSYNKNLDQLQTAIRLLRTHGDNFRNNISGPWFGMLPDFIRKRVSPDSKNVHDDIYNAIQSSLRQTLGAQFTEQEGLRLMGASFDPDLPEKDNLTRAERLLDELRARGASTESMARYWEAPGPNGLPRQTLQGWTPKDVPEIRKAFNVAAEPPYDERWLSPEQEQAMAAYVAGDNVTGEGYASLIKKFAQENGVGYDANEAERVGAVIEAHRKAGGTYGPGVAYAAHSPVPTQGEDGLMVHVTDDGTGYAPDAQAPTAPGAPTGRDGMSWGETGLQALENAPGSLAGFVKDTALGMGDLMTRPEDNSATGLANRLLPVGVRQVSGQLIDIGKSALGAFGITNADPMLAQAIGKHYADQYGSEEAFKKSFAEDPATVLADLSTIVTGFGGLGVKGAELAGNTGRLAKTARMTRAVGRAADPISLAGGAAEGIGTLASRYLPQGVKDFSNSALTHLTQKYPAAMAAFPSGVGGATIEEAVGAGRQRSLQGPNARSAAFTGQMRDQRPASDIIGELDAGVKRLRETASQRYERDIAPITQDRTQLDFAPIQQRVSQLRPKSFGLYAGKSSGAEAAWQQVDDLVRQHAELIAQDPARYATPAALDTFKQHLYDVASQYAEGGDRSAARIAKGAYRAITETISQQAPDYARVMRDYSQAQEHLGQVQSTLTSGGRNRNTDASIRRLQSILRRNDTGHAGQLLDDVNAQPNSELLASVAGRSGEPILPGGLRGAIGAGVTLSPSGIMALTQGSENLTSMIPAQVAALATTSPRLMSEASYGLGRTVGGAERAAKGAWGMYNDAPATTLAGMDALATGHRMSEEERLKRTLLERYGLATDADTQNAIRQYAGGR